MRKKPTPKDPMIGRFFHSIVDGQVEWQGTIIAHPQPGTYLVQLLDWIVGIPSIQKLVPFSQMGDWLFYPDAEEMRHSYEYGTAHQLVKKSHKLDVQKRDTLLS